MESHPVTMVFFDLDNTLFDHKHSLYQAMSAVRQISPLLHDIPLKVLIEKYNEALNHAYDRYLRNEIAYEDQDAEKVKPFL
jgi:FMN phosphatase YigB (HAD superfamily)